MAGEISRRVRHLEACERLAADGFVVDVSVAFSDSEPPSLDRIRAAVKAVQGTDDWDPGTNGNRDDLERVTSTVDALTDAELDAFLHGVPADDLARLGSIMRSTDDAWWKPWDPTVCRSGTGSTSPAG